MKSGVLLIAALLASPRTTRAQAQTNIAPEAQRIFADACRFLAESPSFGITAEIWRDHINDSGEKVQFSRRATMEIKRPNRLHADIHSSHMQQEFWYDGKSLAILDRKHNVFSTAAMPASIDQALDAAHDEFGVDLPLIDLALSDPYKSGMAKVQSATLYGTAPVLGFECYHLAFRQENIDWQVWIQTGPQPLIRKFVINHKNEDGSPEFTAVIQQWDLTERIADSNFVFVPPRDAVKVEMRRDPVLQSQNTSGTALITPKSR